MVATESTRRLRTGANADNGPIVSITRCAAAGETPNRGPIWRMVTFVRQYTAASTTDKIARHQPRCPQGAASGPRSPA